MLLSQDQNAALYSIKKIMSDAVYVNTEKYQQSLIVMPHKIISPWRPKLLTELNEEDFSELLLENITLVLLGVGDHGGKLSSELYCKLLERNLVVECMSLASASRTYAILSAEGRSVAAALIL